ncbi:MAG: hypothetical protein HYR70_12185 [Chloroflexi bacterium]|nr:hypothetical protein [Chloroflexota bacterium]MBI3339389.1 hypothetical protein [Chloroflexota bacterium]
MQNKTSSKNWTDIQLIISSIAIALTLGLWSLFASPAKKNSGVSGQVVVPPQPDTTTVAQPQLAPGQKILFGGTAPQPQVIVKTTRKGGGGAVTTTSSSRP